MSFNAYALRRTRSLRSLRCKAPVNFALNRMHAHYSMSCPFCGGRVQRVVQSERPSTWRARVAAALIADFVFWLVAISLLVLAFWSPAATILGFVFVSVAIFIWHPRRFAYRCDACQTVLSYREVKRAPGTAA